MSPTPPTLVAITAFRLMLSRPGPLVWPACHHCFVQWQKEKDVLFFPLHFPAKKSSQPSGRDGRPRGARISPRRLAGPCMPAPRSLRRARRHQRVRGPPAAMAFEAEE